MIATSGPPNPSATAPRPAAVGLVECPRDAWQGLPKFIPTRTKVAYLRALVAAGFAQIDFGSFVSPKSVPQMADTAEVWAGLTDVADKARWIAIIANERGLDRAHEAGGIGAVGYPLSLSPTFQVSNTGKGVAESWALVARLQPLARSAGVELHVYLSMAFGNPYGEPWTHAQVTDALSRLRDLGARVVMLADTTGCAKPAQIRELLEAVRAHANGFQVGAHLHASAAAWRANVEAALDVGCMRLDSALGGFGGCPFAQDALVGNVPTEGMVDVLRARGLAPLLDEGGFARVLELSRQVHAAHS